MFNSGRGNKVHDDYELIGSKAFHESEDNDVIVGSIHTGKFEKKYLAVDLYEKRDNRMSQSYRDPLLVQNSHNMVMATGSSLNNEEDEGANVLNRLSGKYNADTVYDQGAELGIEIRNERK